MATRREFDRVSEGPPCDPPWDRFRYGYCEDVATVKAVDNADSYAQLALQLFNFMPD